MNNKKISILNYIIFTPIYVIWTCLGLIFWVPLLMRSIILFSSLVVATSFGLANISLAQKSLNSAIGFYLNGFNQITDSMRGTHLKQEHQSKSILSKRVIISIVGEIIYTIVFWGIVINFSHLTAMVREFLTFELYYWDVYHYFENWIF